MEERMPNLFSMLAVLMIAAVPAAAAQEIASLDEFTHGAGDGLYFQGATAGLESGQEYLVELSAIGTAKDVCLNLRSGRIGRFSGFEFTTVRAFNISGTGTVKFAAGVALPHIEREGVTCPSFGRAPVGVQPPIPGSAGLPWVATVADVAWSSLTVILRDSALQGLDAIMCTFDPPTSDGIVPPDSIFCMRE
jgi:hypothetical protein